MGEEYFLMGYKGTIPPSLTTFRCFVDVYSFLDMVLQSENEGLKNIESRHKLSLSGYDNTNLKSFARDLSKNW